MKRIVLSFRVHDWRDHFDSLEGGVIMSDTSPEMLQYWSEDKAVRKVYPTGVPTQIISRRLYTPMCLQRMKGRAVVPFLS